MDQSPILNIPTIVWQNLLNEWKNLEWSNLKFDRTNEAELTAVIFLAIVLFTLVLRFSRKNIPGRKNITLPGIIPNFRKSGFSFLRHLPLTLFLTGLPFFFVALADPYNSFTKEETTYPGRRIVLIIDASGSMGGTFENVKLKARGSSRFYTSVKAAEYFMQLRIKGKFKDLMGLVEFGNEAYVITPFTNDYDNILMSTSLIGEPEERARFNDSGTIIIKAIDQGVELFKMFNFLKASGNVMILISDGEDSQINLGSRSLDSILAGARSSKIPIYFIRTIQGLLLGQNTTDQIWKDAVEKTGGKFYVGSDEAAVINAVNDINKLTAGTITATRYTSHQPRFALFISAAFILWSVAVTLYLSLRFFRKFP